jgi:hypothetical protein
MANLTALHARVSLRVHAMEYGGFERDDGLEADPLAVLEHELYAARCEIDRLRSLLSERAALTDARDRREHGAAGLHAR